MNTRGKVIALAKKGLKPSEIARQVGVSRQRVSQILARPKARQGGRQPFLSRDQERDVKRVLNGRDQWTWQEAESELSGNGLKVPLMKIYEFLKELGFKKLSPAARQWFKQKR